MALIDKEKTINKYIKKKDRENKIKVRYDFGKQNYDNITRLAATIGFGLIGYAATGKSKPINGELGFAEKGLVLITEYKTERLPYSEIQDVTKIKEGVGLAKMWKIKFILKDGSVFKVQVLINVLHEKQTMFILDYYVDKVKSCCVPVVDDGWSI